MRTDLPVPKTMTWQKVSEWIQATPAKEGVHLVSTFWMMAEALKINPLLFYVWCYSRTNGFRDKCWCQNWDAANLGGKFKTSTDGIKDALSEFLKYDDTSQFTEEDQMLSLYNECVKFGDGIVYDEPNPLPVPPQLPPAEEPKPQEPPSSGGFNYKKILSWLGVIGGIAGAVIVFVPLPPGVKTVVMLIINALKGLRG
jgi:hypothetical protein